MYSAANTMCLKDFRREAATMTADKDSFTATANEQLKKQIPVCNFNFTDWMKKRNRSRSERLAGQAETGTAGTLQGCAAGRRTGAGRSLPEKSGGKETNGCGRAGTGTSETVQPEKEPEVMQETGVHP